MEQFRLKFILEDGRKVYASKRGEIQLGPKDHLERLTASMSDAAYTPDLGMFSNSSVLKGMGRPYVKVVRTEIEPATAPIDSDAFLAGGKKAIPTE